MWCKKRIFDYLHSIRECACIKIFLFLSIASGIYAEPMWFRSRTFAYPENEFVSAIGSGESEQYARNDALSSLSVYFGVVVDVKKSSGFSASERNGSTIRQNFSESNIDVESKNILPTVEFTEPFLSDGRFFICAYIKKANAISEFRSLAENNLSKAAFLVMNAESNTNKIKSFRNASEAEKLCTDTELILGELSVLDFESSSALVKKMHQIKENAGKISSEKRKELVFAVTAYGDDGSAASSVKEIAEKEGFSCNKNGNYTISISISFQESSNNVGIFVKPSLDVAISDLEGNVISSYTKSLPKFGHRTLDAAYSKAKVEIVKDLRANLAHELFE